jgi:hypothetical protein
MIPLKAYRQNHLTATGLAGALMQNAAGESPVSSETLQSTYQESSPELLSTSGTETQPVTSTENQFFRDNCEPVVLTDDLDELDRNECGICGSAQKNIARHVALLHNMTIGQYREQYPKSFVDRRKSHR